MRELLDRALADPERGIADPPPVADEALDHLAQRSGGDARTAYGALERAVEAARAASSELDLELAEDALQRKAVSFDKQGDMHYDYASALIKSMRGSDPDASLYYLAAMLEGGEDPRFIVRRMVILASEDIGNADPQALVVATAAGQAVDRVGLPECALNLAQAAIYLALAPKSNAATRGIAAAMGHVREHGAKLPPDHLRDAHYPGAKKLGRGQGYVYPHDEPGGVSDQELLPPEVAGERFYEPTDRGLRGRAGAPARPALAGRGLGGRFQPQSRERRVRPQPLSVPTSSPAVSDTRRVQVPATLLPSNADSGSTGPERARERRRSGSDRGRRFVVEGGVGVVVAATAVAVGERHRGPVGANQLDHQVADERMRDLRGCGR